MLVTLPARVTADRGLPVSWLATDNLQDLRGPSEGIVVLPPHLAADGVRDYDLADPDEGARLYEIVLRRAVTAEDLTGTINKDLLLRWWPTLDLPPRLRELWELVQPFLKPNPRPSFASLRPYATPPRLNDLHGPTTGIIRVRPHIDTSPHPVYDLDSPDQLRQLYRAVVRDGTPEDQMSILDLPTLERIWSELDLPVRCRQVWEARFPELTRSF